MFNILSVKKGKVKELQDEPLSQRSAEAGEGNRSHGEDMEDPVGGNCSSVLRKPSQILPDNSPFLRSCFQYNSCSSQRLSPHIKLHGHNWNDIGTQAPKLPEMMVKDFTPKISVNDSDDETYLFQCSCAGLYQCSVTGLVFLMKGEGDVVYRTVPWYMRLLAQHHKKPAGPLFDIKCQQQSVCQLHLPHCEVISTGGGQFLKVAHVNDEGIEFITPYQITETHIVINITEFSGYGNVKDEDSPPYPVQALILLLYNPPNADLRSVLSVFMLPRNIMFYKMLRDRRKSDKTERYIETSPHCKLHPQQFYTLVTDPKHDLIKVEPQTTHFDDKYHESYRPSFQVVLKKILTDINLSLGDKSSSSCVWEREVCLLPAGGDTDTVRTLDTGPKKTPSELRSCFIKSISGPVLSSLLDKLLDKKVITYAEREEADTKQTRSCGRKF